MPKNPIFTDGQAADIGYCNLRAARNDLTREARKNCEALWEIYEPYADAEYLTEFRSNMNARYWEMYLTTYFVQEGHRVCCPKPGPDVGIEIGGLRIWFEATSPTRGADGAPDQVPELKPVSMEEMPIAQDVPNERMVLRYLNSFSTKYGEQYAGWLKQGIVTSKDAFVIAINPRRLGFDYADTQPPRILQAAFAVGNPYVVIDRDTLRQVHTGYQFRDRIQKSSGTAIPSGVFHLDEYTGLSGLLCSRVDVVNQPQVMGADFQLVPNPRAKIGLPDGFRLRGTYFRIERTDDSYNITPQVKE